MLCIQFDRSFLDDIEGLYPVTLYQKSTLYIKSFKVSFLHKGVAGECYADTYITRFGYKTIELKCYETDLTYGITVFKHCEELWFVVSDR